jgi:hypothetical protein
MTIFRIERNNGEVHDVEADEFTIQGHWLLLSSEKQSLLEIDPLPKIAFVGAYKDIFGFYPVDVDGNRIELVK